MTTVGRHLHTRQVGLPARFRDALPVARQVAHAEQLQRKFHFVNVEREAQQRNNPIKPSLTNLAYRNVPPVARQPAL